MKDRYLFKAKTARIVDTYNNAEDGVWVKGSLKEDCGKYIIFQFEFDRADYVPYEVDPETICQCTGLKDKNGNLIWENDIVENQCGKAVVVWDKSEWRIKWIDDIIWRKDLHYWVNDNSWRIEVIGNKFDNPEV